MMNERAVLLRQIEVFKEHIAKNIKARDAKELFVGTLRFANGISMPGSSSRPQRWDELIEMQKKGLADAEERLRNLSEDEDI